VLPELAPLTKFIAKKSGLSKLIKEAVQLQANGSAGVSLPADRRRSTLFSILRSVSEMALVSIV
jgi:hypothetical protein